MRKKEKYDMKMTDKLDKLNQRLKDVADKFDALKNAGIDEEILKTYLKDKTKLPLRDIKKVLEKQEEFYNRLVKESIADELENNGNQKKQ